MPLWGTEKVVTIESDNRYVRDLVEIVGWREHEIHDAIVYDLKYEFDPKDKESAKVVAEMLCNKMGVHIDGFKVDTSLLIPPITSNGFSEYVLEHDLHPDEWVLKNIKDREERDAQQAIAMYVPDHEQLRKTLKSLFNERCARIKLGIQPTKGESFVDSIWDGFSDPTYWVLALILLASIVLQIIT